MSGEAAKKEALHVALFPWLAFGHMIPFLEIAKHLARRGHKVSFISTPRNIQRLPKIHPNLSPLITFVPLPLPRVKNLPENAEAGCDVPYHLIPHLASAYDGLQDGVANLLETQTPDWLIYDFSAHWLPAIATKLGISQASFSVISTSALCFHEPIKPELRDRYRAGLNRKKAEDFTVVPEWVPFPCRLAYKLFETHKVAQADGQEEWLVESIWVRWRTTTQGCQVYLTRSSSEIEGEWLGLLQELCGKPVVPLGLMLPPLMVPDQDQDQDQDWSRIAELLDKQPKGSVVYVAFGSEVNPSRQDIIELALGLELSGLPFFWALRPPPNSTSESPAVNLIPDGFEDRVKGRGHIWRGWAPQHQILAHESVGGFLTHCGWGSVLEGLYYRRPLIMFPVAYDQGLIARVWEGKKVGVEVPRDEEDGSFTRNSVAETLRLVVVDEEGKIYRDTANRYGAMLKRDQYREMDTGIDYLEMHRPHARSY